MSAQRKTRRKVGQQRYDVRPSQKQGRKVLYSNSKSNHETDTAAKELSWSGSRKTIDERMSAPWGLWRSVCSVQTRQAGSGCRYTTATRRLNRPNEPRGANSTCNFAARDDLNPSPATIDLGPANETARRAPMCHKCPTNKDIEGRHRGEEAPQERPSRERRGRESGGSRLPATLEPLPEPLCRHRRPMVGSVELP